MSLVCHLTVQYPVAEPWFVSLDYIESELQAPFTAKHDKESNNHINVWSCYDENGGKITPNTK